MRSLLRAANSRRPSILVKSMEANGDELSSHLETEPRLPCGVRGAFRGLRHASSMAVSATGAVVGSTGT